MEYTYLLLHPCASMMVDQIFETINRKQFTVLAVYRVPHWHEKLDEIYKNSYDESSTIKRNIQGHAYINQYFFGDQGLIIFLYKDIPYNKLVQETLTMKLELRMDMNETKNGMITILLDTSKVASFLRNPNKKEHKESQVDSLVQLNALSQDNGEILKIFLSYVHCPDTVEQYVQDFIMWDRYLEEKLNEKEIENIIRYHSFY